MTILNYDEFIKLNNGKRLFKLFPKYLKCYDIQYCENKTFTIDNFDDIECRNGMHVTSQDHILYWLNYRSDSYYFCEIIPNKTAKFVIFDNKIKTNICDIGNLFEIQYIIQYLHKEIGLTKEDFQLNNVCRWACLNCYIDVVKYLHQEIKLTKQDFQSDNNEACILACANGCIDIVKYLHQVIKLTKKDFQSNNNYACHWACQDDHLDVVKYLHEEIGLTKQDFQLSSKYAHKLNCENRCLDVGKYLYLCQKFEFNMN